MSKQCKWFQHCRLFSCTRIGENLQHLHHRWKYKENTSVLELRVKRVCNHVLSLYTNCRYLGDTVIDDFSTECFFSQSPENSFICKADSSPLSSSNHQTKLTCTRFQDDKTVGPIFLQLTVKYFTITLSSVHYQILFQYFPPLSCWTELIKIILLRCFCINLKLNPRLRWVSVISFGKK